MWKPFRYGVVHLFHPQMIINPLLQLSRSVGYVLSVIYGPSKSKGTWKTIYKWVTFLCLALVLTNIKVCMINTTNVLSNICSSFNVLISSIIHLLTFCSDIRLFIIGPFIALNILFLPILVISWHSVTFHIPHNLEGYILGFFLFLIAQSYQIDYKNGF